MIKNILYLFVLIFVLFEMLLNSSAIINSVSFSFNLCINNLFPSLFPFMILSNILIEYGFVIICSELFKPIMNKVFKANEKGAFIYFISLISGSPSNAKFIRELLDKGEINYYEAEKILMFTHFVNPLFVIGTIGNNFLNNKKLGVIILISHYIGNIITTILFRNYHVYNNKSHLNIKKALENLKVKRTNFITILTSSIISSINTLLIILGVITTCLVITTIIDLNPIFNGFLEITQGLKYISITNTSLLFKTIITTFLISFGGFSIHAQVYSILNNKNIKYIPYLIFRLIHGITSSIISYLIFTLIC